MNGSKIKASLQIVTLIDMPAPKRSAPRRMNVQTQGLLAKANIPTTTDSIFTDSKPTEQPMVIRAPGDPISNSNRAMMKFSQLIMMCIALAAIWGGLFQIAFADDATNSDFLILFLGGFLSRGIIALYGNNEYEERNCPSCPVRFSIGVEYFKDNWDKSRNNGYNNKIEGFIGA